VHAFAYKLGFRSTMSLFRSLERTTPTRPGLSTLRVVVLVISLLVFSLTIGLAALAAWLMVRYTNPLTVVVGLVLLLVAAIMLPRPARLPRWYARLRREDAPSLHVLVDRAAATIGIRAPDRVFVSSGFDSSTARVGLRRTPILHVGMALWGALSPQQRIALIGHELGQFIDRDIRRSPAAEPAMSALGRLAYFCEPSPPRTVAPWTTDSIALTSAGTAARMSALGELTGGLGRAVMRPLALVFRAAQAGVRLLARRDGHRADYYADHLAARLAGTRAAVELVDLGVQQAAVESVIAASARTGETERGWRAAATQMSDRQAPHLHRLRQLSVRRESSLWAHQPPHGLRARLLESRPWQEPALVLSEQDSARIDAELKAYYERYRRDIAQAQT